jgi:hypothetical protein
MAMWEKSRKVGMQARPAEAETLEGVRTLRSQKHVGPVEEPIELRPPCLPFEIEAHDLLAIRELGVPCRRESLERVAIRGLDLRHCRPQVAEARRGKRPRQVHCNRDGRYALKRWHAEVHCLRVAATCRRGYAE